MRKTTKRAVAQIVVADGFAVPQAKGLVAAQGSQMFTTSVVVADRFGKLHKNVMRDIENLKKTVGAEEFGRLNFEPTSYTDEWNRTQRMYRISDEGFSMLAMGFTGAAAFQWKLKFLAAFKATILELMRLKTQQQNQEWIAARVAGKHKRRELTDTIKAFVEYAQKQGSQHASLYYLNLSKAEYRALFIVEEGIGKHYGGNFREHLTANQLIDLRQAETICEKALIEGMEQELPYKEIYQLAKQRLEALSALTGRTLPGVPVGQPPLIE